MPDKPVRLDPLGIIALASVIRMQEPEECSCENKPLCGCENKTCFCELKDPCTCEGVCSCELKPPKTDLLDVVSNPVFREVVKGLDINKLKSIEEFLANADDIRTKIDAARLPRPSDPKNPKP